MRWGLRHGVPPSRGCADTPPLVTMGVSLRTNEEVAKKLLVSHLAEDKPIDTQRALRHLGAEI